MIGLFEQKRFELKKHGSFGNLNEVLRFLEAERELEKFSLRLNNFQDCYKDGFYKQIDLQTARFYLKLE